MLHGGKFMLDDDFELDENDLNMLEHQMNTIECNSTMALQGEVSYLRARLREVSMSIF